jgi:hypothetical protein
MVLDGPGLIASASLIRYVDELLAHCGLPLRHPEYHCTRSLLEEHLGMLRLKELPDTARPTQRGDGQSGGGREGRAVVSDSDESSAHEDAMSAHEDAMSAHEDAMSAQEDAAVEGERHADDEEDEEEADEEEAAADEEAAAADESDTCVAAAEEATWEVLSLLPVVRLASPFELRGIVASAEGRARTHVVYVTQALVEHTVDKPESLGLVSGHEMIAVEGLLDRVIFLAGVLDVNFVQAALDLHDVRYNLYAHSMLI